MYLLLYNLNKAECYPRTVLIKKKMVNHSLNSKSEQVVIYHIKVYWNEFTKYECRYICS